MEGYVCNFRRRVVRVWVKWSAGLTPKVTNIVPGCPIALEGMPPTYGLLADTVYLSTAPPGSLKDAVVVHVVGNMEDEGLAI